MQGTNFNISKLIDNDPEIKYRRYEEAIQRETMHTYSLIDLHKYK